MRRYLILHGCSDIGAGKWRIPLKCHWLDENGKCSHYEDRPRICREDKPGGMMCIAARRRGD
jgi:Fe-S-cluster containining protein